MWKLWPNKGLKQQQHSETYVQCNIIDYNEMLGGITRANEVYIYMYILCHFQKMF